MEPDDERAISRALAAVLAAAERLDVRALNDLVSAVREPRALDVRLNIFALDHNVSNSLVPR